MSFVVIGMIGVILVSYCLICFGQHITINSLLPGFLQVQPDAVGGVEEAEAGQWAGAAVGHLPVDIDEVVADFVHHGVVFQQ